MWWFGVGAAVAWATCPSDLPPDAVETAVTLAEAAFAEVDDVGFRSAIAALDEAVPCARAALDASEALELHVVYGLARFAERDGVAAARSFWAVRRLSPGWEPDPDVVPPGHPVRALLAEPPPAAIPSTTLAFAPPGGWRVDGFTTSDVPGDSAFTLQGFDRKGVVVYTGYFAAPAAIPAADLDAMRRLALARRRSVRRAGSIGFGLAAAAGAVTLATGQVERAGLDALPYEDVPAARRRANALTAAGASASAVGLVGLGVVWAGRW